TDGGAGYARSAQSGAILLSRRAVGGLISIPTVLIAGWSFRGVAFATSEGSSEGIMIGLRRTLLISIAIGAWVLGLPQVCRAQLPTATGRSFTLSDPAWKLFTPSNYVPRASPVADVLVHF